MLVDGNMRMTLVLAYHKLAVSCYSMYCSLMMQVIGFLLQKTLNTLECLTLAQVVTGLPVYERFYSSNIEKNITVHT